jgi:hypothetical protein
MTDTVRFGMTLPEPKPKPEQLTSAAEKQKKNDQIAEVISGRWERGEYLIERDRERDLLVVTRLDREPIPSELQGHWTHL